MPRVKPHHPLIDARSVHGVLLVSATLLFSFGLWIVHSAQPFPWQEWPLKVWMLDVGQGDALFIEFPTGEQMLVDGGPDNAVLERLGSVLAPWDRTLNAVVLTHPDADHVTGIIAVLDRYRVGTVYESGVGAHTPFGAAYEARKEGAGRLEQIALGDVIAVGEVTLTVLWPEETQEGRYPETRNNLSVNFLLEYGDTSMLFTGDAEQDVEAFVAPRAKDIDVLKVGHHGSLTSTSWKLLELTQPEIALISAGKDNAYGHPHPVVLDRLERFGAQIFRTDMDGDILLTSFGGEPSVDARTLPF
ncbi:MBL fold metallo-hydrolase [Candidatus Uhrbacteria bacterium]|nr:MBL fold metallo-hydrolase [Candidatus Uhrbacteria bacterium]